MHKAPENEHNDDLLRKAADIYTERYGRVLLEELKQLNSLPGDMITEHRLFKRVRGRIAAQKRKPYWQALTSLAACIVIAILLLPLLRSPGSQSPGLISSPSHPAPPSTANTPSSPRPTATGPGTQDVPGFITSPSFEVIPLSAPLPDGFTQTGFEQDYEKSIYFIEDVKLDNVVITLEKAQALPDTSGLVKIDFGGPIAYARQTDGYSLLTFIRDGVLYTLTCRYDVNTLTRLGSAILNV